MPFAHLHCHSYYSMLCGTMEIEALCKAARRVGMESLALTDVNGLYGWVEFVQKCQKFGLRPLCGVDLRAADAHAVLLARSARGYERICRIISDRHLEEGFSLSRALLEDRRYLAVLSRDLKLLETLLRESGPE